MYQDLYSITIITISIILTGLSIKMLDDYMDEKKQGYVPYMLCILCISSALWKESISLFLSSYIIGMFHDKNIKLISGMRVYQEQVLIFLVSALICGLTACLSSFFIICAIQLLDDLNDMEEDRALCMKNWALKIGCTEARVLAIVFILLSICFDVIKSLICIVSALIIQFIFDRIKKKEGI